ncbi:hypothetical protein K4K57_011420 [Colletotrichum sp. SAR 10_99]|nr:hypothetical protein K4K55_012561 [Colletotrichum sp. SAR 10_96]KAJ5016484.1 hypothetical protein K4K57_011420 [Colletotrichum sp. SAR 10_99]
MDNAVQDIHEIYSVFSGASTFYPGDSLIFSFEDPSVPNLELHWLAIYNIAEFTGPLETPGDFYNFFVFGLLPVSYYYVKLPTVFGGPVNTGNDPTDNLTEPEVSTGGWSDASFGAFPDNPDIVQGGLGIYGGGIVTGYFYEAISTGMLSIPRFNHRYGGEHRAFGERVDDCDTDQPRDWNNFTSWAEYEGPRRQTEDDFSLVERYDLKDPRFHAAAFDGWPLTQYLDDDEEEM